MASLVALRCFAPRAVVVAGLQGDMLRAVRAAIGGPRRAVHGDARRAHGGGGVHRSGVGADEDPRLAEQRRQLIEIGLRCEHRGIRCEADDFLGPGPLAVAGPGRNRPQAKRRGQIVYDLGIAHTRPELGIPAAAGLTTAKPCSSWPARNAAIVASALVQCGMRNSTGPGSTPSGCQQLQRAVGDMALAVDQPLVVQPAALFLAIKAVKADPPPAQESQQANAVLLMLCGSIVASMPRAPEAGAEPPNLEGAFEPEPREHDQLVESIVALQHRGGGPFDDPSEKAAGKACRRAHSTGSVSTVSPMALIRAIKNRGDPSLATRIPFTSRRGMRRARLRWRAGLRRGDRVAIGRAVQQGQLAAPGGECQT